MKHPKEDYRLNRYNWCLKYDIADAYLFGADYEFTSFEGMHNLNLKERNMYKQHIPKSTRRFKNIEQELEEAFRNHFK